MSPIHYALFSGFTVGLAGLTFHRAHLLSALLCLESMMLALFIALSVWTLEFNVTKYACMPVVLLAFSACEASIGLALLVATTRTHGTDHLQNFTLLKC